MEKTIYDILIKPVISEKSMDGMADGKYTFIVPLDANKFEIKNAVEKAFDVKVENVNTIRVLGKFKRMGVHRGKRPDFKKAIVTLKDKSKSLPYFEGIN